MYPRCQTSQAKNSFRSLIVAAIVLVESVPLPLAVGSFERCFLKPIAWSRLNVAKSLKPV